MTRELFVTPLESIVPKPGLAYFPIETEVDWNGAPRVSEHPRVRVSKRLGPKVGAIVEREVRPDDVDSPQS
jgi:hypothetical protein